MISFITILFKIVNEKTVKIFLVCSHTQSWGMGMRKLKFRLNLTEKVFNKQIRNFKDCQNINQNEYDFKLKKPNA